MLIARRSKYLASGCVFRKSTSLFRHFAGIVKFMNSLISELSYFHVVKFPEYRASGLNNFAMLEPPGFETFQFRDALISRFLDLLIFK